MGAAWYIHTEIRMWVKNTKFNLSEDLKNGGKSDISQYILRTKLILSEDFKICWNNDILQSILRTSRTYVDKDKWVFNLLK